VNLGLLLEMAAEGAPDRVVVSGTRRDLTAAQLFAGAHRAACGFVDANVEHVALIDVNSEAVPLALFGAALAGLPFAPLNYRLDDEQLNAVVGRLAPALVIVGPQAEGRVAQSAGVTLVSRDEFLARCDDGPTTCENEFVDPDAIAVLLFTSGTTGEPKAAVLRHRHLTSYVIGSVEFMGADNDEAQLVSVPPYHVAGIAATLSSLYGGRRAVYLPSFDADAWVTAVAQHGVTHAMVVPTMLGRVLDALEARDVELSSLRHLSYGGGRMPVEVIERAMKVLPNVDYVNAYGLTETSSTIALLGPDDHRRAVASDDPAWRARLRSVGQPLPSIEVEIRGADGTVVPPGERGEIYVRGEQVAGEYLGREMLTADGWFPTNDAGFLDSDGFLYLDGRLDDVIVRGGENLSPGEIEDCLCEHPAVREAAAVGVPDPEWGESVAAVVVLEPGADVAAEALQQWTRERLRSAKSPSIIAFRAELPYNETGKLLRRVLRDELSG
jgi:acyl-CoA synthetase (AMP-forming)/AMP-acid ligase II